MIVTPVGISGGMSMVLASTMVMATRPAIAMSATANAGHDQPKPWMRHQMLALSAKKLPSDLSTGAKQAM